MSDARALAFDVLKKCLYGGQYAEIALGTALDRSTLDERDRAFCTRLVYGVLEKKLTLDYQIDALSNRSDLDDEVRLLCEMGLTQCLLFDRVPDYAAVNATVDLAPKKARGFVNALLRQFLRNDKKILLPNADDRDVYLSVKYSVGLPLVTKLLAALGDRTEAFLSALENEPKLYLRINTLKTTRDEYCARLIEKGIAFETVSDCPTAVVISSEAVESLPGFSEGCFFVQDTASQLLVLATGVHPGDVVFDVCACPGGKTVGMAIEMGNQGRIYATDLHKSKLSLVEKNARRLGVDIIAVEERDARRPNPNLLGIGDVVLCDVPCSGFGVLSKKPELRYKNPADSVALPHIQADVLSASSTLVKKGGRLVYSTCTVFNEENGDNVKAFLTAHPDFTLLDEKQFYPHTTHTDGFYYAVMQRK